MTDNVIIAIISASGTVVVAGLTMRNQFLIAKMSKNQKELEIKVDGRLSQILDLTQRSSHAEGVLQGTKEEQDKIKNQ
jgi:hypothetical protein